MDEKQCQIYRAKLAEQAERYNDMASCMNNAAKIDYNLSPEQRNLLSVAYKNRIGPKRAAYRVLTGHDKQKDENQFKEIVQSKIACVVAEIIEITDEILATLEKVLENEKKPECKVFFLKMKGDYYRYAAEVTEGADRQTAAESADKAYSDATAIAQDEMKSTSPIRLGLALNYSVFHFEIKNDPSKACKIAKESFDDAIAHLDGLPECAYNDSKLIMQLLRDNLTLWTSSNDPDADDSVEQSGEAENKDDSEQ